MTVNPEKRRLVIKTVLFLLTEIIALSASCFALILSIFSYYLNDVRYYTVGSVLFGFLLMFIIWFSFFAKSRKRIKISWYSWITALILFVSIYEGIKKHDRSLILSQKVDLTIYQAFSDSSRVALTDEPSTLQLTDSLPCIDGATAFYPLYSSFVRATYPEADYDINKSIVACSKTEWAFNELIYWRHADVIFTFAPSEEQRKNALLDSVEFDLTPVGREAFIFFVNAQNPVEEITSEQLHKIYSGKITNWNEIGGKDEKIMPFQRNINSGSQTAFLSFMEGHEVMTPKEEAVMDFMEGIIYYTADYRNYKNALGYSFCFFTEELVKNNQIKILKIDGIHPSKENICNGHYPLIFNFYAITRSGDTSPNTQKLIDWILSPQGQSLVEKTGYCGIVKN
jgi:phosphate transport system substrate-binding protein